MAELPGPEIEARALLIGERLDLKALEAADRLAAAPLALPIGQRGCAVLFRYGVVVLFGVSAPQEAEVLARLRPHVQGPLDPPELETLAVRLDPETGDTIDQGVLRVRDARIERLQVIADILAKSVVLAQYESRIAASFDRTEPLALRLEREGRGAQQSRELIRDVGSGLLALYRMVGRVEVGEKPELLWEHPELERMYLRLKDEYELKERQLALERKLDLISRTAQTQLELLQARRSLRVEWYIVILIVVEILLTLYELFIRAPH